MKLSKDLERKKAAELEMAKLSNRVLFLEERVRDLRDDIDYLFRSYGKLEETFLDEDEL